MVSCAIMQPTYNPWLGYFDLMDKVDLFIYLDNVQLVKRSWQVRNRIKTIQGEFFLSIPIKKTKKRAETLIKDALINDLENWRKRHLKTIEFNYKKAKCFKTVFPFIKELIYSECSFLGDFNINVIEEVKKAIGISTFTVRSSELPVKGKKDVLLVNICKCVGADMYVSPQGSAVYIEKENPGGAFVREGIKLYYHNYEHPTYKQLYGQFMPYMGIFDLLLNEGFERALNIIRSGRRDDIFYLNFRKIFRGR